MQNSPVILIVDDQPQNNELMEAYLVPHGYVIVVASNGTEALDKLASHPIDLILLDVLMPDMNGFEVARRIRQNDAWKQLPIILVTALRETQDRVKGIEAGCDDFITKPVEKNELLARVRSLLKVKAYNDLKNNYQKELEIEVAKKVEELKSREEILIAQSRHAAMGNMIGMIAHQWRQPLSIIGMIANDIQVDIGLEALIDNTVLNQNMNHIHEQVNYLSETVEDFKNYFKPNKEKESILVTDVMEKTFHLIGQSFANNNIEVQKNYNLKTEIKIFPNELMQVFINIINNAKDAIISNKIQNPKIVINISEEDENITVTIADNAGGIPPEVIDNIGNLYFTTKNSGGTGLGMYMSKNIVEKHLDGVLKWENREDGACFIIILPKERVCKKIL